jgi:hypothetical protein
MVEPITLSVIIIGIVTSALLSLILTVSIIKNGKDITDSVSDWFRKMVYDSVIIYKKKNKNKNKNIKDDCFFALCETFNENCNKINCHQWQLIDLYDQQGKEKSFRVPTSGSYIELELVLKNKSKGNVLFYIIGEDGSNKLSRIIGFKIYYRQYAVYEEFMRKTLHKYMSESEINDLLRPNTQEIIPGGINRQTPKTRLVKSSSTGHLNNLAQKL